LSFSNDNLERKLGIFPVTNIVVANIIGAGIFTTTGYLMDFLGNPVLMLVLWLVGGVVALCGAMAFGELGATFPEAGGEYTFISKLFHPMLGFLSGWLSLIVGFSAPIAASAIGFSNYFIWAFPSFQSWFLFDQIMSPDMFSRLLAVLVIVIFSLLHARGVVLGARIQNGLTVLKVALVIGLIIAGFAFGQGDFEHLKAFPKSGQGFSFNFTELKSVGLSLMFIMFAYSGWNSATYIGSEIKNPSKVIPFADYFHGDGYAALFVAESVFCVCYSACKNGRRTRNWRRCCRTGIWRFCRYDNFIAHLFCLVFFAQCIYNFRAAGLFLHGSRRVFF